jgi:hypothetical protein
MQPGMTSIPPANAASASQSDAVRDGLDHGMIMRPTAQIIGKWKCFGCSGLRFLGLDNMGAVPMDSSIIQIAILPTLKRGANKRCAYGAAWSIDLGARKRRAWDQRLRARSRWSSR